MSVEIDVAFGAMLDGAVAQFEANRPRTKQKLLGPSSLGGCREYLRATIAGDEGIPERPRGVSAAFVGTVVGDALEEIFVQYLGAITQVACQATLPKTKLVIAGSSDAVFVDENIVSDLKGCESLAEVVYDLDRNGFSPDSKYFKYAIQIAVYVLALVQAGVLDYGKATARLVFYERSGGGTSGGHFLAIPIGWDALMRFIEIAEERLGDVQKVLEAGSPEESRWGLRDQSPSLCFALQCPFREACWSGSEWMPSNEITGEDEIRLVNDFVQARQDEKDATKRKDAAKEALRALAPGGTTPDGKVISWKYPKEQADGSVVYGRLDVMPR